MVPKYPVQCSYQKRLLSAGSLPTRPLQPLSVAVAQPRIEQAKDVGFIETSYTHDILPTKSAARTSHPIQGSLQGLVKRFLLRAHARLLGPARRCSAESHKDKRKTRRRGGVWAGAKKRAQAPRKARQTCWYSFRTQHPGITACLSSSCANCTAPSLHDWQQTAD